MKINPQTNEFRKKFFPGVSKKDWNDYRWQMQKRYKTTADLKQIFQLSDSEINALESEKKILTVGLTPYYASLLNSDNPNDPLRRTVLPSSDETILAPGEYLDPLDEDNHSPVPGIVHRYPDRALFLVTDYCPVYCRYCTRSRLVGGKAPFKMNTAQWQKGIDYIAMTPEIRDVLISGGDPLVYTDDQLAWLLAQLRAIKHVDMIRIGTKIPFVLPQRITPAFARVIKRYHPLFMSLHVNHPREITLESSQACERLANAGVPLGSQTVLLKGVNDDVDTIHELMHALLKIRVKPYYLLQCDPIVGSSHFRTPVQTGIDIIHALRGFTSGYAVPHFIVDIPGGGGKISLVPEYITGRQDGDLVITNYAGHAGFRYPDY